MTIDQEEANAAAELQNREQRCATIALVASSVMFTYKSNQSLYTSGHARSWSGRFESTTPRRGVRPSGSLALY